MVEQLALDLRDDVAGGAVAYGGIYTQGCYAQALVGSAEQVVVGNAVANDKAARPACRAEPPPWGEPTGPCSCRLAPLISLGSHTLSLNPGSLCGTDADHLAPTRNLPQKYCIVRQLNPLERLNKKIKRHTCVVDIFPDHAAIILLMGAVLLEQENIGGSMAANVLQVFDGQAG